MQKMMLVLAGFVAALALMAAVLVWPSRYRYDQVKQGQDTVVVRTDRVGGGVQRLNPKTGWVAPASSQPIAHGLPPCDASNVGAKPVSAGYAEAFAGMGGFCLEAPSPHPPVTP